MIQGSVVCGVSCQGTNISLHEMSFLILYLHVLAIIDPSHCLVWTKTHLKD
jgi:hypothetical protein